MSKRILLCDDSAFIRMMMKDILNRNGYEICGNIRENYIDGIWNKDREEDWLSEIQIPVRVI